MSLNSIVQVQIDRQTASVSRVGFGTPLIMSAEADEESRFATTAKIYTALDQMGSTGDNFDTGGVTFKKAQAIFSQNPKVAQIVVGKRSLNPLMTMNMIPIVVANTDYVITIGGRGVEDTFTFDSGGSPTVATIIAGMVALINAGTQDVLATDNATTDMDIESAASPGGAATAGKPYTIEFDRSLWTAQNVTPDPGVVTDLNLIRNNVDGNDDWYLVLLDSYGKAEIESLAATIETLPRLFFATTSDADVLTSATTDVGSNLQASAYDRTALIWHEDPHDGPDAAWAGLGLPFDPGSITWAYQTLAGIAFSLITPSEIAELVGKSVNHYIRIAGNNVTIEGHVASGEWIDVMRGIDLITARLKENIFSRLVNLKKIPYTDPGISVIESEVRGVMQLGIANSIFTADPAPVVSVPLAADVDANDKANRLLPDVTFTATLAGAIHKTEISGIVTV